MDVERHGDRFDEQVSRTETVYGARMVACYETGRDVSEDYYQCYLFEDNGVDSRPTEEAAHEWDRVSGIHLTDVEVDRLNDRGHSITYSGKPVFVATFDEDVACLRNESSFSMQCRPVEDMRAMNEETRERIRESYHVEAREELHNIERFEEYAHENR